MITRLATAISLSLISTAANSISIRTLSSSPSLSLTSPEILMPGYRVAAWLCTGCIGVALGCCFGLGRVGVVGRKEEGEEVQVQVEGEGGRRRRRRA